ncbi:MAG: L-fuculokinase [Eubacteriales bacterium]
MAFIGLDIGTTGCKALSFGEDGQSHACSYMEYVRGDNVYEIDGEEIWRCTLEVLADCFSRTGQAVRALAVSSFGESFVPVDIKGNALMSAQLYTDKRGRDECDLLRSSAEEDFMRIAGVKPHPMYSLPKMMALRKGNPDIYARTDKFLFMASYIIFKLTGQAVTDYSLAARSMAFDVREKRWSRELLSIAGIDEDKLPAALPSGSVVGEILPAVASRLGLSSPVLVATGGHDQVCAAVGAGVLSPGVAVDGIGTVECITPVFDKPMLNKDFLDSHFACVPFAIADSYVTYAFSFTGGAVLKWYRDQLAKYEEIIAKERGISVYRLLDEQGSAAPTDLIVVPLFAGSATPDMNDDARGAILGLRLDTSSADIYRALLEGVTFEIAYNIEALERSGIRVDELRAVGGGAKSPYWLGIKASVTGRVIVPLQTEEAGATGAAMLAGVATRTYPSLTHAAELFVKTKPPIYPNPRDTELYKKQYQRYKKAREATINLWAD